MRFIRQMKRRSVMNVLWMLCFGAVMLFFGMLSILQPPAAPVALESVPYDRVSAQDNVTVAQFLPLAEFASQRVDYSTRYFYTVAMLDANGDTYIMALRTTDKTRRLIEQIYGSEQIDEQAQLPALYGSIGDLSGSELEYFEDSLEMLALDPGIPVVYACLIDNGGTALSDRTGGIIVGLIFLLAGVWMLIRPIKAISGAYQQNMLAAAAAAGSGEQMLQWLDQFYAQATPLCGVRLHPSLLLFQAGPESVLLYASNLVWVYIKQTQHRVNFIPTAKTYAVVLRTLDRKTYEVAAAKQPAAQELCAALKQLYPEITVGYAKQLEARYERDPGLLRQSEPSAQQSPAEPTPQEQP